MIATRILHRAARAFGAGCILLALTAFSSTAWAQAGYVHEVSGIVAIHSASLKARQAKVGDTFESETLFLTGGDGKVILKFADGQVVVLSADSALRVGRYRYVENNLMLSVSTLELKKGEMRVVTGLIGATNRDGMRISAGDSMITIKQAGGADFTVAVNPDPQEIGHTVVALGEISVRTPYGPIYRVASGQYAPWRPGRTPRLAVPLAAAPAVIQAAAADLWTTVLPASTPVAVASAARTAGAIAATAQPQAAAKAGLYLAGYVEAISNKVSIKTASGRAVTAAVGATFEAGSSFETGSDGRVVLKFADGQLVVLGPGSLLKVNQYQFDPGNVMASSSALELVNGAMRIVTGSIHTENPEGISIIAGASIIDILNATTADFIVAVDTKDKEVGVARVALGEISVRTPYGPIDKIELEQSNLWGPEKTPTSATALAKALGVVEAAIALQLSGLPDNTAVAVAPAASAAAAAAAAQQAQAAANADPENASLQAAAQAATELASLASEAAAAASEAIAGNSILAALEALPATAAGPGPGDTVLAQAPAIVTALRAAPILPTVTPGAAGGCTGSVC